MTCQPLDFWQAPAVLAKDVEVTPEDAFTRCYFFKFVVKAVSGCSRVRAVCADEFERFVMKSYLCDTDVTCCEGLVFDAARKGTKSARCRATVRVGGFVAGPLR